MRCHYCGVGMIDPATARADWATWSKRQHLERTVDHKTPRIRGGSNGSANLVPACRGCNSRKGVRPYLDVVFERWHAGLGVYGLDEGVAA